MSSDLVLITSTNEGNKGISLNGFDGSNLASNFKECVVDTGAICLVGGSSSFSGQGSTGDYVVAAQSKKPVINVYHWGKPQIHYQCHIQEITTSLASDPTGTYLLGGTKRGWIYIWEIATGKLLTSFQAHFKAVTHLHVTVKSDLFISAGEDGMARAWDMCSILGSQNIKPSTSSSSSSSSSKRSPGIQPYRSWNPHTLPIKGMHVLEYGTSIRIITCSLDRNVIIHDLYMNKQIHRIAMPQSCESLICNTSADYIFVGSSNGTIFVIDLSNTSAAKHAPHASIMTTTGRIGETTTISSSTTTSYDNNNTTPIKSYLEGHSKAVVSLSISADDKHLISGSDDGSARVWDIGSFQCLHEIVQPRSVSNVISIKCPEMLQNATATRPKLSPFEHLKKYTDETTNKGAKSDSNNFCIISPRIFGNSIELCARTKGNNIDSICAAREVIEARLDATQADDDDDDDSSDVVEVPVEVEVEVEGKGETEAPKPKGKSSKKRTAAKLTDSTDFLSFTDTPAVMETKSKKRK
jgi:pre-rRNA-processing protein IPI3